MVSLSDLYVQKVASASGPLVRFCVVIHEIKKMRKEKEITRVEEKGKKKNIKTCNVIQNKKHKEVQCRDGMGDGDGDAKEKNA